MITIVIPTYGSEQNIPSLVYRLYKVLKQIDHEIIFVDDCGPDNTFSVLKKIAKEYSNLKVVRFSRNFGQQLATSAGLKYAKGDAVIIMDDDLQDPPEFIPNLIKKWEEGYDVVYTVRNRKEGWLKKKAYTLFYRIFNKISYLKIPVDSGDFGLMDRKVVDVINSMPEHSRLVRGLRTWSGFKQIGLEYDRPKRTAGKSGYNLIKTAQFTIYCLLAFSNMPLYVSFVISGVSFITGHILDGFQFLCIGILGKYIVRISDEVNMRPLYVVEETINI